MRTRIQDHRKYNEKHILTMLKDGRGNANISAGQTNANAYCLPDII